MTQPFEKMPDQGKGQTVEVEWQDGTRRTYERVTWEMDTVGMLVQLADRAVVILLASVRTITISA